MKAVAQKFKMNNFEMLPKENEIVRAFYHFIGTGIRRESLWLKRNPFPIADWNGNALDYENKSETSEGVQESEEQMEVLEEESFEEEEEQCDNLEEESIFKEEILSSFRKSIFKMV